MPVPGTQVSVRKLPLAFTQSQCAYACTILFKPKGQNCCAHFREQRQQAGSMEKECPALKPPSLSCSLPTPPCPGPEFLKPCIGEFKLAVPAHGEGLVGRDRQACCAHAYIAFPCLRQCGVLSSIRHHTYQAPQPRHKFNSNVWCSLATLHRKKVGSPKGKFLLNKKLRAQLRMADREVLTEHYTGRPAAGSQVALPIMVGRLGAPVGPHNKAQQGLLSLLQESVFLQ